MTTPTPSDKLSEPDQTDRRRTMPKTKTDLVRYVSPFGSPAWMSRAEAERYLAEDDARWLDWQEMGLLSELQRVNGPPRIETAGSR